MATNGTGTTGGSARGRGVMDLEAQVADKMMGKGPSTSGKGFRPRVPGSIPKPPKRLPRKNRGPF